MKGKEKDLEEALKIVTEKVLEQLSTVQLGDLSGEITDIEAPACEKEVYPIYFDRTEKDNFKWLALLKEALRPLKFIAGTERTNGSTWHYGTER